MTSEYRSNPLPQDAGDSDSSPPTRYTVRRPSVPILNYTLATVCPACDHPTIRRACKVRCERCGFMWDCSEL
ncbi:MAG: hypothetical protein SF162_08490 [bacterium]|nr:hypothetical protein [bacterium]